MKASQSTAISRPARADEADSPPSEGRAPEITVVVPTFNERDNVPLVAERIRVALAGRDWELLFVDDDSPDGTAAAAHAIGESDRRVRAIRRVGRRGLSGACLEGILASQAEYVAVMDADLQHDETLLAPMLDLLRAGDVDLVVGSRYTRGGSLGELSEQRARLSRSATVIARIALRVQLTDPMSGFFMIRRSLVEQMAPSLATTGFKILLDIVATGRGKIRLAELPYSFRARTHGESKLDAGVALDFGALVVRKFTANLVPFRFLMFCLVGLSGLGLHLLLLRLGLAAKVRFEVAQAVSTILIIAWNFTLNNAVTYRDRRLAGKRFLGGLIRFEIICGIGVISNVGIASWLYGSGNRWWIAGSAGALMGAVWNYMVSAALVWRGR